MAYLLDKDPLNFEDREELKLDELKVPKLPDKEGMGFTMTIDSKDQPDLEKMFPQMKLIDELWNKLHEEKTSLDTLQQFVDKLGVEVKITIAPKTKA